MKCPGQDIRYWKIGDIFESPCPKCGNLVEFFKDDNYRKCNCGYLFMNIKNAKLGCAEYCEFADKCIS